MSKVSQWSTTANSNNSPAPNGWPEFMARSAVNDCAREMMASLARWYTDQKGTQLSTGSGAAYTLTTATVHAALTDQTLFAFRAHTASTGTACTLNVDALGVRTIKRDGNIDVVAGDIQTNQLVLCLYNATNNTYEWLNAPATTVAMVEPQGYLTPVTATPVIATDATAATSVFYTPYKGNMCPIYNGTRWTNRTFSELTLALSANHLTQTIYDVFIWDNAGVISVGTGPAWASSAAGTGNRGAGAGTAQLLRLNGRFVNAVAATLRNGGATTAVAINQATYVGSILIDAVAGQVTCHRSFGQNRKFGVWNAYNRKPITLIAGDATASWTYSTATARASNNSSANNVTVFTGLPEELVAGEFTQRFGRTALQNSNNDAYIAIGLNSTTTLSGTRAFYNQNTDASIQVQVTETARYTLLPTIGRNALQSLELGATAGTTFFGTEQDMRLTANYLG